MAQGSLGVILLRLRIAEINEHAIAHVFAAKAAHANENVRALISMMARSTTRSDQRPDTLMQDRSSPARPSLLATRGRTELLPV
ncbi:hypothetical protein [Bradyrhizobium sp. 2S1]|uniref:hypothetical protein n=1 Tax=Bradyrhizobium sp. 2S1 TaxID=1404429 RepID=UPI0014087CD9|nr:hypothetical protein [Bradyrhizobium sp. 2S1]MCK7667304.1 hypothetical protein [Bradyrhizobium sp. 2S1]